MSSNPRSHVRDRTLRQPAASHLRTSSRPSIAQSTRPSSSAALARHATSASTAARQGSPAVSLAAGIKRKELHPDAPAGEESNIRVVVRCRGRNTREIEENVPVVVKADEGKRTVELPVALKSEDRKTYAFDKVFSPAVDQASVFDETVKPLLEEMLKGYNCTCFAYGQTGTGKTHTMSGDVVDRKGFTSPDAGIIPRLFHALFAHLAKVPNSQHAIKCSFIELYNEELRDLLAPDDTQKLKIFEHGDLGNVVQGADERYIHSAADGIQLLLKGNAKRQVAATKCNDRSSRSHTVFTLTAYRQGIEGEGSASGEVITLGKLNLVDLAGSESIKNSGASDKRAAEAGKINKSLLTLGQVINALVDKSQHIPYRQSNLTRLLQDSLGGRTKTCIIATISPGQGSLQETLSTLDYANRAKSIKNQPQLNSLLDAKLFLPQMAREMADLKKELAAARAKDGVWMASDAYDEMKARNESRDIVLDEQQARIKVQDAKYDELTAQLMRTTEANEALHAENDSLHNTNRSALQDVANLHDSIRRHLETLTANRHNAKSRESLVKEVTEGVLDSEREFGADQQDLVEGIKKSVEKFKGESLGLVAKCEKSFDEQGKRLEETTNELDGNVEQAWDALEEALKCVQDGQGSLKTDATEALKTLKAAVERSQSDISSRTSKWATTTDFAVRDVSKSILDMIAPLADDIQQMLTTNQTLRDEHQTALRKLNELEEESRRQHEEADQARQREQQKDHEEHLAFLEQLVAAEKARFAKHGMMEADTALGLSRNRTSLGEALASARERYSQDTEAWQVAADALPAQVSGLATQVTETSQQVLKASEEGQRALVEASTMSHDELEKGVRDLESALSTKISELHELSEMCVTSATDTRSRQTRLVEHVSEVAGKQATAAVEFLREEQARVEAFDEAMAQDIATLKGAAEAQVADVERRLGELRDEIHRKAFAEYEATGKTPVRSMGRSSYERLMHSEHEAEQDGSTTEDAKDGATLVFADPDTAATSLSSPSAAAEKGGLREISSNRTFNPLALSTTIAPPALTFTNTSANVPKPAIADQGEKPLKKRGSTMNGHTASAAATGKSGQRAASGLKRPGRYLTGGVVPDGENAVPLGDTFEGAHKRKSPRLN